MTFSIEMLSLLSCQNVTEDLVPLKIFKHFVILKDLENTGSVADPIV